MCQSPNSSLVRRTIDLNYANKQRGAALRWLLVNGALLALLSYDLWVWCGGCAGSAARWAEAAAACVLLGNCAQHAARLSRSAPAAPLAPLAPLAPSPLQRRLLGLNDTDLESSSASAAPERSPDGAAAEPGSLSAQRSWRTADSPSPPHSPSSPHSPASPTAAAAGGAGGRVSPDEFISDGRALAAYIRQQEAREAGGAGGAAGGGVRLLQAPPRPHQVALLPERSSTEGGEEEGGAPLWRRLHVNPRRLTEYNLSMRLWLHVTVVSRVARELEAAGAGALEGGAGGAGPRNDSLVAFLRPFADKQYVAERIKELSRGGCLSGYRWDGGGRGWRGGGAGGAAPRPADADLLLQLFVTYLDLLTGGAFSARHVGGAGGAGALVLRRAPPAPAHPPHFVLQLGEETLDVGGGRDNLLHTLLLFLAAAARGAPPALCRLHLGPASLNMLWILGR